MLVAALTNFGVKNQVPQVFFKFVVGDLMLVSSYEVDDILFFESLVIYEAISDYGAQSFTLHTPRASLPLVTCSSPHITSKEEDIMYLLGHLLLTLGAYHTWFAVQGLNISYYWVFLTWFEFSRNFSLTSVDFNCSTWV